MLFLDLCLNILKRLFLHLLFAEYSWILAFTFSNVEMATFLLFDFLLSILFFTCTVIFCTLLLNLGSNILKSLPLTHICRTLFLNHLYNFQKKKIWPSLHCSNLFFPFTNKNILPRNNIGSRRGCTSQTQSKV